MRIIKFRGKTEGGEWIKGNLVCYREDDGEDVTCIVGDKRNEVDACVEFTPVDPATVGQFTVLHDKNNRGIYEGDIIVQHAEDMPDIRGAVVYDVANARFGMAYTSYWESGSVTHFDTLEQVKCYSDHNRELTYEVIGNVHDNPDLMLEKDINVFKCEM
jgi:uncharacterized phage protein (TIGR01671 family)